MKAMNQLLYQTLSARTSRLTAVLRKPPDPVRLLLSLCIAGVGTGVFLFLKIPCLISVPLLTQGLRASVSARTLWDVFTGALLPMVGTLCGILFCGSAAFGQALLLLLLFARGTAAGLAMAECFAVYPFRRAFYAAAVLILPLAFLSMLVFVYALRIALRLSGSTARYLLRGQTEETVSEEQHGFLLKMAEWLLILVLLAGMHTVLLWMMNDRLLYGVSSV